MMLRDHVTRSRPAATAHSEHGASLILAMVFLLAVGLVIIATSSFAVNASVNAVNTRGEQTTLANVESEASAAIQAVRGSYSSLACVSVCSTPYAGSGTDSRCTPSPNVVSSLGVYCVGFGSSFNGTGTRTVDFYVCVSGLDCAAAANSASVALFAEVAYEDLPPGEVSTANQCTATSSVTCGITLSINSWDVRLADS